MRQRPHWARPPQIVSIGIPFRWRRLRSDIAGLESIAPARPLTRIMGKKPTSPNTLCQRQSDPQVLQNVHWKFLLND